jgi:2-succinyl-5-enolpyruvyl-6-hydroxy-3-cyclohexene-1-carboxylate synthase
MAAQGRWARALISALARAGVRDVVVSPGSRSTPFVLAAAEHPGLACHDVLDERSAAFFALGQARATGRPSVLLCTSGTAAAHYYPAVIEASHAFVPLVVLSADRPFERMGCGANQTVDQAKLFGDFVRHYADLGVADEAEAVHRAVARAAMQAVHRALHPAPGPVHLNVHARKPLEPGLAGEEPWGQVTEVHGVEAAPAREGVAAVARVLEQARRGAIVAGPAPLQSVRTRSAVHALAKRTGFALCAEATSQLRFAPARGVPRCDGFDWLWRSERGRSRYAPDVILQLGAAPTSVGYERLAEEGASRRVVIAPHGWPDPASRAELLVQAPIGPAVEAVARDLGASQCANHAALAEADRRVWAHVEGELARAGDALTEAGVTAAVVHACRGRAVLAVGNSLPVRHVDAWAHGEGEEVPVASQRGASGIDGLVSGAAGLAQAQERPVVLLVGDVSFLHDVGGLLAARHARAPLVVVVVNNGGGRIFEELPLGARQDLRAHMGHFVTEHGAQLAHAAHLFGHRHRAVDRVSTLREALREAMTHGGCTVLEAVVPPGGALEQRRRVERALEEDGALWP